MRCDIIERFNGSTYYVELFCDLDERLKRNMGEKRLAEKPSKRELELSNQRLLQMEKKYKMNTDNDFFHTENYIRIDNTELSATEVVKRIRKEFNFP